MDIVKIAEVVEGRLSWLALQAGSHDWLSWQALLANSPVWL